MGTVKGEPLICPTSFLEQKRLSVEPTEVPWSLMESRQFGDLATLNQRVVGSNPTAPTTQSVTFDSVTSAVVVLPKSPWVART